MSFSIKLAILDIALPSLFFSFFQRCRQGHGTIFPTASGRSETSHVRLKWCLRSDVAIIWIPSGEHTKSYGKWPFIVDFPMKNCDFPWQNVSSPDDTNSPASGLFLDESVSRFLLLDSLAFVA